MSLITRFWPKLIVCLVLVVLSACGGDDNGADSGDAEDLPPSAPHVAMVDNEFNPATISATAGETVSIHLQNDGENAHTFTSDGLGVDVTLDPGQTEVVEVEVPEEATEFTCNFHGSSGMTGTLTPE